MVIYSNYNRRKESEKFGETFPLPSLTDQLDYEPLKNIIDRFMVSGQHLPVATGDVNVDELQSNESVDEAFAHLEGADTSDLNKVEQAEVLATAQLLVEQLQAQQAKPSEGSVISEPGTQGQKGSTTDSIVEGKNGK